MRYSGVSTEVAYFHLMREYADPTVLATFTTEGEPVSKARARFTGYGSKVRSYTPAKTLAAEEVVRRSFMEACPDHEPDGEATFGVTALFFNGTRQRRDVDNMLKLILDGLNGVVWADDSQVVEVSGRKSPELPEHARTEIVVYRVGATPGLPTIPCLHCAAPVPVYPGTKRRYCSRECVYAHRRERDRNACMHCGNPVQQRRASYCSTECAGRAKRKPERRCLVCAATVSDYRKQLCRECYERLGVGKHHVSAHCDRLRHDLCLSCACPCHEEAAA